MLRRDPEQPWHPSYWLAALGGWWTFYLIFYVSDVVGTSSGFSYADLAASVSFIERYYAAIYRSPPTGYFGDPFYVVAGFVALYAADLEYS